MTEALYTKVLLKKYTSNFTISNSLVISNAYLPTSYQSFRVVRLFMQGMANILNIMNVKQEKDGIK